MSAISYERILNVCLIGSATVGKSALLNWFAEKKPLVAYEETTEVEFTTGLIQINNQPVKLEIWDTPSAQRYLEKKTRNCYLGMSGLLLIFDITNLQSFQDLSTWLEDVRRHNSGAPILLIGTKLDLSEQRVISFEEAQEFATSKGLLGYVETSAKTGENVKIAFSKLTEGAMQYSAEAVQLPEDTVPVVGLDFAHTKTTQKELIRIFVEEVHESLSMVSYYSNKGSAIGEFLKALPTTTKSESVLFRQALRLFLQQDRINLSNMTTSGKKALEVLNAPESALLRQAFGLTKTPITYRHLREIAADTPNYAPNFFHRRYRHAVYAEYLPLPNPLGPPSLSSTNSD